MRKGPKIKEQVQFYKAKTFGIDIVFRVKNHLKKIEKALNLIKEIDPILFKKALKIRAILIFHDGDDDYGEIKDYIWVNHYGTFRGITITYLASLMVHEAWHIVQRERGVKNIASRAERGAYLVQKRFLLAAGDKYSAKWLDRAYKEKWWLDKDKEHKTRQVKDNKKVRKTALGFLKQYQQGKLRIKEIKI